MRRGTTTAGEAPRIEGPAAWYARDLERDTSWIRQLTDAQISEIDAALRHSTAKGLAEQAVTRADFPLPELAQTLAAVHRALEHGRGIVLLRGFPVERYTYAELRRIYWGIGTHLGTAESQNIKGELIQEVTDLGFDYTKVEHRGSMTSAELRPHCDVTDIVGLFCLRTARTGGESSVRSSMTIYNEIAAHRPELLEVLYRGFRYDLDGKGPTGHPREVTHRIPVFSWHRGHLACCFNQKAIEDGARKIDEPLDATEQAAVDAVAALAVRPDIELRMRFQPGDMQWLNNYVILHARTRYEDWPDATRKRLLLRLWLNHPGARPLTDAIADKTLAGPRKGVVTRPPTYTLDAPARAEAART